MSIGFARWAALYDPPLRLELGGRIGAELRVVGGLGAVAFFRTPRAYGCGLVCGPLVFLMGCGTQPWRGAKQIQPNGLKFLSITSSRLWMGRRISLS